MTNNEMRFNILRPILYMRLIVCRVIILNYMSDIKPRKNIL